MVALGQGRWNCDHGRMPLLEREPALEILGGWFAEARAGRGRVVLVGGEAGVGKTTLVDLAAATRACGRPLTRPWPWQP